MESSRLESHITRSPVNTWTVAGSRDYCDVEDGSLVDGMENFAECSCSLTSLMQKLDLDLS